MALIPCPAAGCQVTFRDDLDATVLLSLIQIHERTAHPQDQPGPGVQNTKAEKVRRPLISSSGTNEEWQYFLTRWDEYKLATRLTGHDIVLQLLECADDSLRRDLIRAYGSLANETEENALEAIKTLAVKPENILVARAQLHNMHQDRDESARSFCARLRGQAGVCNFTKSKTCTCNQDIQIDYSEEIIRDALIRGLSDEDIKLEILGQDRQNITLDETLKMIEAKESGKRSAGMLSNPSANAATSNSKESSYATSSYRKVNKSRYQPPSKPINHNKNQLTCSHCGRKGHGDGSSHPERKKNCPAYNHQCTRCGFSHHYEKVCRSSRQKNQNSYMNDFNNAAPHEEASGFIQDYHFDSICTTDDSLF